MRADPISITRMTASFLAAPDFRCWSKRRFDLLPVTTSSKFKARKFWRGVMRPLAPARSGDARGRVRGAVVSMSSRRSQDQPRHDAAVLKKHGYTQ